MLSDLSQAAVLLLDPTVWLFVVIGLVLGIVVGAIPGLTATMAVAVLLPISFFLPPQVGIPFLIAITKGAFYSGAIPAILIGAPGTGAAAATVLDGYPLAKKGMARKALDASLYGSVVGDILSNIIAVVLASFIASFALLLGPPELVIVVVMGLLLVSLLSGASFSKGILSAGIGVLLAAVGIDPAYGATRLTFGVTELSGGIGLIPMLLGLYGLTEVLLYQKAHGQHGTIRQLGERMRWPEVRRLVPTMLRSTGIGAVVGMIPALNQVVAGFLAWGEARRRSSKPEEFGKGSVKGVTAAETSNNAVNGPALIPLLIFGIPGDTITAVLLAALLVQGISPGPRIFIENGPLIYSLFFVFILASVILLVLGWLSMRYIARLGNVKPTRLLAITAVFSLIGAYAIDYSLFAVGVAITFGLVGYVLSRNGIPREPLLITFLLAPLFEAYLGQSLALGGWSIFWERTPALVMLVIAVPLTIFVTAQARRMQKMEQRTFEHHTEAAGG